MLIKNQTGLTPLQANNTNGKTQSLQSDESTKHAAESRHEAESLESNLSDKLSLSEQSRKMAKAGAQSIDNSTQAIIDTEQAKNAVARLIQGMKTEPATALAMYGSIEPATAEALIN